MPACANCGFASEPAARFCPQCGTEFAAAGSREQRKTVTVLFCDLTGSTALGETLDPERLRALLARYFERMSAIVERHGGSVEKFIGDAVMAVFGVPTLHEDDALRAVRAAIEMRDAIPELGLQGRIGVMTGEVVTGTAERLATGDAVNVAARLEQAAQPGEVLIGQPTLDLVREAVEVGAAQPLELKGKSKPVPAYRLALVHDVPERRHAARFVGREQELAALRDAWEHVLAGKRCELVTIVGDAGVGKTHLVAELVDSIDATVVRGRCLPYGEGITYWPVIEVLKQLDELPPDEAAAQAIRSLLGQSQAPTSADEIARAVRKTLEHAAARRPLVVVFDDIQWGEESFRDLIEHIALLSSGAPILLLCMARPELVERHPTWPVRLRLEPLGEEDVLRLMAGRTEGSLGLRIARAAGGNPLFVEEMLAMAGEAEGEVAVPPTLKALLAARLDQLERAERSVLERGSIEGELFHRGAVQALTPGEIQITPRLASLVRKELIRPDRSQLEGEDGFRFRHLLIRDAAYEALPKALRADLHERFATWLRQHGSKLVEADEIVGYHLEQAYHYRTDLGVPADPALAAAARSRLTAAGQRAQLRSDYAAAASLYERAAALAPPDEIDFALEIELGESLELAGRGADAVRRADALALRASVAGDRVGELFGRLAAGVWRINLEPEGVAEELAVLVEQALPIFEAAGNDLALYVAHIARGEVAHQRGHLDVGLEAMEQAAGHARRAGLPRKLIAWLAAFRTWGTTPVSELLAWLDENDPQDRPDYFLRAHRAEALARLGRSDEAHAILAEARSDLADRGAARQLASITGIMSVEVELLAGNPTLAAELGEEGCRLFEELGDKGRLSTAAGYLAQALYRLDRLDEADAWAARAPQLGGTDDAITQILWRQVRAKVLARRGKHADAEQLAREVAALSEETDMLDAQGDVYADLAEVLTLGGKPEEAMGALEMALARFERKENRASAERMQARLSQLRDAPTR
jgi:class 3 adenylate cyclase/tetratricopeptide (TPR) repeat protein